MIYATVAIGLLAAASTAEAGEFKFDDFFSKGKDLSNKGDKGGKKDLANPNDDNEGNEGLKFKFGGLNDDDEGNEGDEGFKKGGFKSFDKGPNTSDKGTDDHNEGDEGDEGFGPKKTKTGKGFNGVSCKAVASASAWSDAKSKHVSAIADAFNIACHPEFGYKYKPIDIEGPLEKTGVAAADAMAKAAGKCVSFGNAFGCAAAKSQAAAWASATAEAHAKAWAVAYNGCACEDHTAVEAQSQLEVVANTFIQLSADVYASAEVEVCVKGTQVSSAKAFVKCWARAYAKVWAQAIAVAVTKGKCWKSAEAATAGAALTGFEYLLIEHCSGDDSAHGNAGSETGGDASAGAEEKEVPAH